MVHFKVWTRSVIVGTIFVCVEAFFFGVVAELGVEVVTLEDRKSFLFGKSYPIPLHVY
jgi:hypothetical protein